MDEHHKARRRHSVEFKSQVVQACSEPGASTAGVALAFGLNANLVRQWQRGRGFSPVGSRLPAPVATAACAPAQATAPSPFVALALPAAQATPAADIRIEVRRGALAVNASWPSSAASECAAWLCELLR